MGYNKENSGVLFINDRKEQRTHPDRKGSALIDGVDYWVSAWEQGNNRLSLSFRRKDSPAAVSVPAAPIVRPSMPARRTELNDDSPF